MHRPFLRHWRAALLAVPLLVGCGDDPIESFDPSRDLRLRIINASLAAGGAAEFLIDDRSAGLLGYGQGTPYFQITGGNRTVVMRDEPDGEGLPGPTLFSAAVTLTPGQFQTLVISGAGSDLAALTATDQSEAPGGNILLRVLHAGAGTPSLDLYVIAVEADLQTATPLVSGIDPREVTEYQTLPFGRYQLRLTTAGTKDVLAGAPEQTFDDGQVATLVVFDNPTPGQPPVVPIIPDGGDLD